MKAGRRLQRGEIQVLQRVFQFESGLRGNLAGFSELRGRTAQQSLGPDGGVRLGSDDVGKSSEVGFLPGFQNLPDEFARGVVLHRGAEQQLVELQVDGAPQGAAHRAALHDREEISEDSETLHALGGDQREQYEEHAQRHHGEEHHLALYRGACSLRDSHA